MYMRRQCLDVAALHTALSRQLVREGITWAQASADTGLAAPIFTRLKQGRAVSTDAYLTLCKYLGMEMPFTKDDGQ